MTTTISVTNEWQLHVPLAARELIGMEKPGLVILKAQRGQIIIKPKKSKILSLGGSLNHLYSKKPINLDSIRDKIDYS